MNRRTLLKKTGLMAAGFAGLPSFKNRFVDEVSEDPGNAGYFGFPLGDIELVVVTDGHGLFKPAQPMFAPGVASTAFEAILQENFLPAGAVDIAFNVLVAKTGN